MIRLDVPTPWGIRLQDSATPNAEGIHELYDHIMFYLCLILGLVSYILYVIIKDYKDNRFAYKYVRHGQVIEIIWTIFPAVILLLIAFPSFILLYLCDEVLTPAMTIKVIGLQWYWKYEYSDFVDSIGETIEFESYVIPDDMLEPGALRLLDTDTCVYYGQCSELCGVNHGMMPIKLECVNIEDFIEWLGENEVSLNSSMVEQCTVNALILVQF